MSVLRDVFHIVILVQFELVVSRWKATEVSFARNLISLRLFLCSLLELCGVL